MSDDHRWRNRVKELRVVSADDLRSNPRNFRRHPQAQNEALRGLLSEIGIAGALLAYEDHEWGLTLIDGHLRQSQGGQWPVLVLDVDRAEANLLLATYDPIAALAEHDGQALDALLREVSTGDAAVMQLLDELAFDVEPQAVSGGESRAGLQRAAASVKAVFSVSQLATVEAALQATGKQNRGAALLAICEAYLAARQLDI